MQGAGCYYIHCKNTCICEMCIRDRSGTEPKIRVMVEGQDLDAIHRCADRIVDKINKRILGQ